MAFPWYGAEGVWNSVLLSDFYCFIPSLSFEIIYLQLYSVIKTRRYVTGLLFSAIFNCEKRQDYI